MRSASISSRLRKWPSGRKIVTLGLPASAASLDALVMSGETSFERPVKRDWIAMCGKSSASQRRSVRMQRGAEQHAGELANIARPAVAHQHGKRVIADRQRAHPRLLGEAGEEMAGEGGDVAAALAQGGDGDGGRGDPFGQSGIEIGRERAAGRWR